MINAIEQRVLEQIDTLQGDMIRFLQKLIQIPTINPPGEAYDSCARFIGDMLVELGFNTEYIVADDHPDHSSLYPRVNVLGRIPGSKSKPALHFNGHTDVVPAGEGWTFDPFGGELRDGRVYGRGACDMKGGIAAAIFAMAALQEAGVTLEAPVEVSGTVDEESGGFAGMAYLANRGYISPERTSYVIIPEPLNVDRICIGHRGVYWFQIETMGHIAHGSMPFLGKNAIDMMGSVLHEFESSLMPELKTRTTSMPIVPPEAKLATLNTNGISGGQTHSGVGSPCVADRCSAVFDRRFLKEESFEEVRMEITKMLEHLKHTNPGFKAQLTDLMTVYPVETPRNADVVQITSQAIEDVLHTGPSLVASPGTYDHKHVFNIGGVQQCIAYGPGMLHLAHQPDEYCEVDHLIQSCKVMALSAIRLMGVVS